MTTYIYENGNKTSIVDPDKHETKWTYDGMHDVMTVTMPDGEETTIKRNVTATPKPSLVPLPTARHRPRPTTTTPTAS